MMKLANEALRNRDLLASIMKEIEFFEFEDRKHAQLIITELFNYCPEIMTEALYPRRKEIVLSLLDKYTLAGMATFMGSLLRLFAKTNVFIKLS